MNLRKTKLAIRHILVILIGITLFWLAQFPRAMAAPRWQEAQDIAIITEPASNAVLQGVVPIVGSANHPSFQFYIVEFSPEPITGDQWQIIGEISEAPIISSQLAVWDTTLIPDGSYTIRLRAVRLDGNYSEFFAQQVVVSNSQPVPTDTPVALPAPAQTIPTATSTALPPTPTIIIDQPIVDTPTPRPVETSAPLQDPDESGSFLPTVTGFSLSPLRDACIYGGGIMLSIFLLFGFFSALRIFVQGFIDRIRRSR